MAQQDQNDRPLYASRLTRPRYVSLCGGAITALSIVIFCAFAGVSVQNLAMPLVAAVGFSVCLHYLLANFALREEKEIEQ